MPLGCSPFGEMTAKHRREEEHNLLVQLTPLTLVIKRKRSEIDRDMVRAAFIEELGELDRPTTIEDWAFDPGIYYEAVHCSQCNCDNEKTPVTLVKVWYYQVR